MLYSHLSLAFQYSLESVIVLVARSKAKSKGNAVLLLGDEDAGKTAILTTVRLKPVLSAKGSPLTL